MTRSGNPSEFRSATANGKQEASKAAQATREAGSKTEDSSIVRLTVMAVDNIYLGFGTAGLGDIGFQCVTNALHAGFRSFDTAEEADYWYDQKQVGDALESFFTESTNLVGGEGKEEKSCLRAGGGGTGMTTSTSSQDHTGSICEEENLKISTKIPPWELTSLENIRQRASASRDTLVGFCDQPGQSEKFPLDVYYIHAPECWKGWHTRCDEATNLLPLRDAWRAMEAVAGIDFNAKRIGLSNVYPEQLLDIINFVKEREEVGNGYPPPRLPDVLQSYADPLRPALELREICEEHGIEFVSFSTLGTQWRQKTNPVLGNDDINDIANKVGRSPAEVVLSWALQRG